MKTFLQVLVLLVPAVAVAQDMPRFDPAQMQILMEQGQKMQACIAKIDNAEMAEFQKKAESMGAEIDALCDAGKNADAKAKAIGYGRQMVAEPAFKQLQTCFGPLAAVMPGMAWAALDAAEKTGQDVCGYTFQPPAK